MDAMDVECPKCGEPAGKRCRSLTSRRTTDTHEARFRAYSELWRSRLKTRDL